MNYYKHHIGDYRRDTSHLSLLEHGIYRQLLDQYYLDEKPFPVETESVMRRLSARTEDEKKAVETVLKEFFYLSDGWHHRRCDMELNNFHDFADTARNNGKLGGRPRKTESVSENNRNETQTKANHKPITKNHKPRTTLNPVADSLPDWLNSDTWAKFKKHRGSKFTEHAQELTIKKLKEFNDAGQDPNATLETSIANGWKGVFAEKTNGSMQNGKHRESIHDKRKQTIDRLTGADRERESGVVIDGFATKGH